MIWKKKQSEKLNALTLNGKHLLWVCVDDEKTHQEKIRNLREGAKRDEWALEDCFKLLIQYKDLTEEDIDNENLVDFKGCDMDVKDNFGELLLNHTIKEFKMKSFNLLLKAGANMEKTNSKKVTPIGQAILSKNIDALDILLE